MDEAWDVPKHSKAFLELIDGKPDYETAEINAGSWIFASDNDIHFVEFSEVVSCKAYMLFYERIN
jgi:hypothetical protein